jgi:transposase
MLMQSLPTTDLQPATEVSERPRRRTYTADYKRRIVREADAAKEVGAISALLRREGLFSSTLSEWRRAHDNGDLGGEDRTH